jgi:hypothetical protein
MITPVVVGLPSISPAWQEATPGKRRRPDPSTSGWIRRIELVDQAPTHQRLNQLATAQDHQVLPGVILQPGHGFASPGSRAEFIHGKGSVSVVEATYFWVLFITSVNGLGWGAFGQNACHLGLHRPVRLLRVVVQDLLGPWIHERVEYRLWGRVDQPLDPQLVRHRFAPFSG